MHAQREATQTTDLFNPHIMSLSSQKLSVRRASDQSSLWVLMDLKKIMRTAKTVIKLSQCLS